MIEEAARRLLRGLFGSGADISAANPLPVTGETAYDTGIATGGTNVTLIDTAKDWGVNMWADAYLEVVIGAIEYHRRVVTNTNDTLTFNALPALVVVTAGDPYKIKLSIGPTAPTVLIDPYTNTGNIAPAVVRSTAVTAFRAIKVTIHWTVATSNPVIIALDANAGPAYDTVLRVVTLGQNTDMVYWFPESALFEAGDVITVQWADDSGGVSVWGVQIGHLE